MFFRRRPPREISFEERLGALTTAGFSVEAKDAGRVRVAKGKCAVDVVNAPGSFSRFEKAGILVGDEIAVLVDGGYQKFFQTAGGSRVPALASDLKALHNFEEDLREGLGQTSLYNESLGTTCELHVYDRLEGRGRPDSFKNSS